MSKEKEKEEEEEEEDDDDDDNDENLDNQDLYLRRNVGVMKLIIRMVEMMMMMSMMTLMIFVTSTCTVMQFPYVTVSALWPQNNMDDLPVDESASCSTKFSMIHCQAAGKPVKEKSSTRVDFIQLLSSTACFFFTERPSLP